MLDLLCIGEVMAELRWGPDGKMNQDFAGDSFNTAVYAARILGADKVGFYSHVGADPMSKAFYACMHNEGLNPDYLKRQSDLNIGIYSVSTDPAGERSFHYWRNQSAARQMFVDVLEFDHLPNAKIVYLSGITMAILSPTARANALDWLASIKGKTLIAYDSNYRPKLWEDNATARQINRQMWDLADIALPSIDDEMDLFGESQDVEVERRFASGNFTTCAIKRGKIGPLVPGTNLENLPTFLPAISVLDTTAAGDSFNGGFLAAWAKGQPLGQCLHAGHELASEVVGIPGAIAPRK